jgi:hypothetical protein
MKRISGERVSEVKSRTVQVPDEWIKFESLPKKQERYPMPFQFQFMAGQVNEIFHKVRPEIVFRAEHLVSNVREPGIAFLTDLRTSNIICIIGTDPIDLCSVIDDVDDPILGTPISFPSITPAQNMYMHVKYSGRIPQGYEKGEMFIVTVTLVGTAAVE